jgi:hypothetical protein
MSLGFLRGKKRHSSDDFVAAASVSMSRHHKSGRHMVNLSGAKVSATARFATAHINAIHRAERMTGLKAGISYYLVDADVLLRQQRQSRNF